MTTSRFGAMVRTRCLGDNPCFAGVKNLQRFYQVAEEITQRNPVYFFHTKTQLLHCLLVQEKDSHPFIKDVSHRQFTN